MCINTLNKVSSYLVKFVIYVFLLIVVACESSSSSPTPELNNPTIVPTSETFIPAMTEVSGLATDNQLVPNLTPLPQFKDYIIYSKFETKIGSEIWWAINPSKLNPLLITSNITPRSWSPSNKLWLFTGNRSIYVANSDGSNVRVIYNYKEYEGIDPFWLTDDVVLFNAYKDPLFLPPDIYSLDISSGKVTQLFSGSRNSQFIQATFPTEKKWLLASWPSGPLDIVDENGKAEKFFGGFSIPTDPFAPYPPIQRINRLDKYLFQAKGPADTNYKLWLVSKQETPQILFDPGSDGIDQFAVSPDEQYLALTYSTIQLKGVFVYIFSLENFQLIYKWAYPYKLGSGELIWSPDSQSIVTYYSESDIGYPDKINSGIQIMDIKTGETKIILNEDVTQIIGWHFLAK